MRGDIHVLYVPVDLRRYSNDPALRKCIIKKSGLSKVPEGLKKWAGPHGMVVTNEIVAGSSEQSR